MLQSFLFLLPNFKEISKLIINVEMGKLKKSLFLLRGVVGEDGGGEREKKEENGEEEK